MTGWTIKLEMLLAIFISFAFSGVSSRPVNDDHLNMLTIDSLLDVLEESGMEKQLSSLLAQRSLEEFMKEGAFSRSSRGRIHRIASSRPHLPGNMVRYG